MRLAAQPDQAASETENGDETPAEQDGLDELLSMDIEQLGRISVAPAMETVVTTVSRQASTVGRSPAAVFVITREMIRRSGARTIPEALRLAPGVEVARIDASRWAITVRGGNDRFANKLLVQIDGRSVYTPLFAGVYWDVQDLLLEDVERIEVIRGPGATVWGANAVNGVINILTRRAQDTTGAYAIGGGGTEEAGFSGARVGGVARGGDLYWRAWGKWREIDRGFRAGQPTFDDWRQGRGGFRTDWTPNDEDTVTFQGDYYQGHSGKANEIPFVGVIPSGDDVRGGDLLARWTRRLDESRDYSLLFYFDRAERTSSLLDQRIDTYNVDFQDRFPLGRRHNVIWGLGYRHVSDELLPGASPPILSYTPPRRDTDLFSGFVQDEATLVDDHLYFTIGTKAEENDFTGFEIQPTARLLWSPDPKRAAWAAVSRAVRTPSRSDDDIRLVSGGGFLLVGSRDVRSEELIAYEIGYRAQPQEWFSWDIALFYNVYQDLIATRFVSPVFVFANNMSSETYGLELSANAKVTERWKLFASYSFLRLHLRAGPGSAPGSDSYEGASPKNQVLLRSSWDLGRDLELDLLGRYVDNLPTRGVPSYISMDLRLGWRPTPAWELAVVAQNLLDEHHKEFGSDVFLTQFTEARRGVYGSLTWRY